MSHGLAALCFTSALALALSVTHLATHSLEPGKTSRKPPRLALLGMGFFTGWLVATRPVSALALVLTLVLVFVFASRSSQPGPTPPRSFLLRAFGFAFLGALPGIILFVLHQRAATLKLFSSSQSLYYSLADGPPGCFRYGFGAGIGCLFEHGDFVRHNLPDGYGAYAATATTLRRLKQHLIDAGNAEPFILLVLFGAILAFLASGALRNGRRHAPARLLPIAILLQIAVYVPFYFDGNYPGGGARFFADVLPLEHVLAALATSHLAAFAKSKARSPVIAPVIAPVIVPALVSAILASVFLGFAFRAGFEHAALRDREGGLPMFEPIHAAGLPDGALVFFDTDHGLNLAFDPQPSPPRLHAARFRGDALDRFAWQAHGRPPAFRYVFPIPAADEDPYVGSKVGIVPLSFLNSENQPLRIEAENLWPPIAQYHGYALPRYASGTCASAGRILAIYSAISEPHSDENASVELSLPARFLAGARIAPSLFVESPAQIELARVTISVLSDEGRVDHVFDPPLAKATNAEEDARCIRFSPYAIAASARKIVLTIARARSSSSSSSSSSSLGAGADKLVGLDRLDLLGLSSDDDVTNENR